MPITFNSFTPSTIIRSANVNTNFTTIKNFVDGLRPQLHIYIADLLLTGATQSAKVKIRTQNTLYFSGVDLLVETAPTGADLIVDINKNGSSIFSTRPQIAAAATSGGTAAVFSSDSITDGDILTFDIDQVGSTEPGRDLTISLAFYY